MTDGVIRRRSLPLTFAALCLVAAGCAASLADDGSGPTPTPRSDPQTTAALQAVREAVNDRPAKFGGAYLDVAGTTLTVLVAGANESTVAEIRQLVPIGAHVVWLPARFSLAELQRISDEIVVIWQDVGVEQISSVSVDIPRNRVLVAFPVANPELQTRFGATYGDAVTFTIEPSGNPL